MRRYALLTMLLVMPAAVMAQGSRIQTGQKPKAPSSTPAAEESGESKLTNTKASQSSLRDRLDLRDEESADEAEAATKSSAKPVELASSRAQVGGKLYLTNNPAAFKKALKEGSDELPTATRIGTTSPVVAMVLVNGCKSGRDGKCNLTFTSRTAGPDGAFDQPRTSPPWKPEAMSGSAQLAPANFALRLGPGDPPGRYTVEVTVNDLVAKTKRIMTASVNKPAATGGR